MRTATIDINGYCNIDCSFCYQDLDGSELSADDVLGRIEDSQADTVEIGGGEPLLHKGLFGILRGIAGAGRRAHISTNATFIPKGMLDLEETVRDATTIQVSLHAGNPELYQKITGSDFFDRVIENTARFKERYTTLMTAAIYQENVDNVPQILDVAERLGVPLRVNLVMPVGKGAEVELIGPGQVQELRTYLFTQRFRGRDVASPLLQFNNCTALEQGYGIGKKGPCPLDCGMKTYTSPRGETRGCEFVQIGQ